MLSKRLIYALGMGLLIGVIGNIMGLKPVNWQWTVYVLFANGLVAVSRIFGESLGTAEGNEKVAGMQKYLDHMKAYYAEQLTKAGHKEKIL